MAWAKYKHLMLPEKSPGKVTSDIDFTYEAVVQRDVLVVKIHFQLMVIYKWSEINFDVVTSSTVPATSFAHNFSCLRNWSGYS